MGFRKTAISGIRWTSVSSVSVAVIKLVQFAVLAHYLSPRDFGLMAIVMTLIGFSALFIDLGISAAIVHKQDINEVELSSLYWLNMLVSIVLFLVVVGIAPLAASFYEEPELIAMLRWLGLTFIISGIGNQFTVLLQKKLKFKELSIMHVLSSATGFVVALYMSIEGFGVYSLVAAAIVDALIVTTLSLFLGFRLHRPRMVFNLSQIKPMISFGLFQMGERSVNYLNGQFDILLIGKLFGPEVLGVYSIAKNISNKPYQIINPILNKVTFPIMSKVQDDDSRLRKIYLSAIDYLCSVNFPIYILIIMLSGGIILTFFGDRWTGAIVILQILSGYRMFTSFGNPIGSLQLAKGRADLGFYWNFALFLFIPVVIFIGSFWGLVGVASSLLLLQMILFFPAWYFLVGPLAKVGIREYSFTVMRPFVIAFLGGLLGFLIDSVIDVDWFSLDVIIYGGTMVLVGYFLNKKYNTDFIQVLFDFMSNKKE